MTVMTPEVKSGKEKKKIVFCNNQKTLLPFYIQFFGWLNLSTQLKTSLLKKKKIQNVNIHFGVSILCAIIVIHYGHYMTYNI